MENDNKYMLLAVKEAKKGRGLTRTNPLVGAVIVKDDYIISKGYHRKFGGNHAEIDAINNIGSNNIKGATLYVTLEPCSTYGKTPPCTDAIIKNNIKRVVIGTLDPNPLHNGNAVAILRKHNVDVQTGILEELCKELIVSFIINIREKRPYIILKLAMTLDGKIATSTGDSKWITNSDSRKHVHKIRKEVDAVMVGKNTVLHDNPELTIRHVNSNRQPDRIMFDSNLEIPFSYNVFKKSENEKMFIVTKKNNDTLKLSKYRELGVELINNNSLKNVLDDLYKYNIGSILLEGGSELSASMLKEKMIDKVMFFYAPKIIGGDALNSISNLGLTNMRDSVVLDNMQINKFKSGDFLVEGNPVY
jgi:diaminohydroxyphosphoribosylaminopyrimidine deaminase / 5-amino-6-(5-phosphoribosylamino)uracil reductase